MKKKLEDYAIIVKNKAGTTVLFEVPEMEAAMAAGLTVTMESIHKARQRKLLQLKGGVDEDLQ